MRLARGFEMVHAAAEAALREEGTGLERLEKFLIRYADFNMADFGQCVIRTSDEMLSPLDAISTLQRDQCNVAQSDGGTASRQKSGGCRDVRQ